MLFREYHKDEKKTEEAIGKHRKGALSNRQSYKSHVLQAQSLVQFHSSCVAVMCHRCLVSNRSTQVNACFGRRPSPTMEPSKPLNLHDISPCPPWWMLSHCQKSTCGLMVVALGGCSASLVVLFLARSKLCSITQQTWHLQISCCVYEASVIDVFLVCCMPHSNLNSRSQCAAPSLPNTQLPPSLKPSPPLPWAPHAHLPDYCTLVPLYIACRTHASTLYLR